MLYPPEQEPKFNPDRTTLQWMLEDYPQLSEEDRPWECTMKPGEVQIFVINDIFRYIIIG